MPRRKLSIQPEGPDRSGGGNSLHPLEAAAAFTDDRTIRAHFLDYLHSKVYSKEEASHHSIWHHGRAVPPPEDPAFRLEKAIPSWFHPNHSAWYTTPALRDVARRSERYLYRSSGSFLRRIRGALQDAGLPLEVLEEIALSSVERALEGRMKASTDHGDLADCVALAKQEEVEKLLLSQPGVARILLLALRNPSEKAMVEGLKALAGTVERLHLLQKLGRGPTAAELLKANVKGAGAIWAELPWELFEPAVKAGGAQLRGGLLRRAELRPDELRKCLIDHPGRREREEPTSTRSAELELWPHARANLRMYYSSQRVRRALQTYPQQTRALVAFRLISKRKDLADYVDCVRTPELEEALKDWRTPLRKSYEYDQTSIDYPDVVEPDDEPVLEDAESD